jgi:peptide-methionine (S)-S-oxide reductase
MGDHSESTEIDFDPSKISYAQLLDVFWRTHSPCAKAYSRQYMSGIWTHGDEQKRLALESKAREEQRRGAKVATEIAPLGGFTPAEDYHQKYELRCDSELAKEFAAIYTDTQLMNSTAAMRVNAALCGHVPVAQLRVEIDGYGLSAKARDRLLRSAR